MTLPGKSRKELLHKKLSNNPGVAREYLLASQRENDPELLVMAIGNILKAREDLSAGKVARDSGLASRSVVYKWVNGETEPKAANLSKVTNFLASYLAEAEDSSSLFHETIEAKFNKRQTFNCTLSSNYGQVKVTNNSQLAA